MAITTIDWATGDTALRLVDASFEVIAFPERDAVLALLESAGRTCYKSEAGTTDSSAGPFVQSIIRSGHESVIEHSVATVRIICDRGVSHELVRHRLASYSQESTRYANYAKERFGSELTVIRPCFWGQGSASYEVWTRSMSESEAAYMDLVRQGVPAEQARSVLPNSLKTEVVMTCNLREWRHVFRLRCARRAHPQMREIMLPLRAEFAGRLPEVFGDLLPLGDGSEDGD